MFMFGDKIKKRGRKMNKKGIFFTLITIAIIGLFLASYSVYHISEQRASLNDRIDTMNNFVFSTENDLQRKMYISGYRTLLLFEKRISETGQFIDDVDKRFNETFINGSLYGVNQILMQNETGVGSGATFEKICESLQERANKNNLIVNLSEPNVSFIQTDPWNVKAVLRARLLVKDKGDLATWNKTIFIESLPIEIKNFHDPFYINGSMLDINFIKNPNSSYVTNGSIPVGAHIGNITNQLNRSYYIESPGVPSFLDRYEGNYSAKNIYGIESFVDFKKFSSDYYKKNKTRVDYIYFSTNNPASCKINNIPGDFGEFRLDCTNDPKNHTNFYNVSCSGICSVSV
jgi:hypothetical protein